MSSIVSPFSTEGGYNMLERRDQENALLAYKLRCVEEDKEELKAQLERCVICDGRPA